MTPELSQPNQPIFGYTEGGNPIYIASPKEALRKVHGFTDTACSVFDHFSLARAIAVGYTALSNPSSDWQDVGMKVLENIEQYLDQAGVFTRMLLPSRQGFMETQQSDIEEAQKIGEIVSKLHADLQRIPQQQQNKPLQTFLRTFPHSFSYLRDFSENVSQSSAQASDVPLQAMYSYYPDAIFTQLFDGKSKEKRTWAVENETFRLGIIGFDERRDSIARHPDELVQRILQSDRDCPIPELRCWGKAVRGGETFERLLTAPIMDGDTYGKRILNFLANIPKGDLYYQRLAEVLFLSAASRVNMEGYGLGGTNEPSARILFFQRWLADRLVAPAFGEAPVVGFDALVQTVVEKSSPVADIALAKCVADAFPPSLSIGKWGMCGTTVSFG